MSGDLRLAARAIAAIFLINGFLMGSWGARIPAVKDGLSLGAGQLGIVLAGIAAGALVTMPLAGAWAARAGSRRPTTAFVGAMCAAPAIATAMPSYGLLIVAAVGIGMANGGVDVAMNTQGTTIERRRGRLLLGKLHAAFSAGGLAGAGLGAVAVSAGLGPTTHLVVAGLAGTLVVAAATRHLVGGDESGHAESTFARPSRALLALGVLAFACLVAEGAALDWSAVYVDDDLAASASFAALAYAAFSALMLAGRLLSDPLATRLGPVALLRGGGVLAGGGLAIALAVGSPWAALAGFAALGAGLSVVVPSVFRTASARGGAPALAAVSTMGYTGFLAGPPLIGAIAEAASLTAGLALVAAAAGTAALLAGAVRPRP